jgi:CRP/FNR family transcriptional regulator, dissimilatory nitrate respiration regulator
MRATVEGLERSQLRSPSAMWLQEGLRVRAQLRQPAAGDILFSQEDPATAVYAVESDWIRGMRRTVDDHLVALHTARAGKLFAEAALFSEIEHCDAVAAVPSRSVCPTG